MNGNPLIKPSARFSWAATIDPDAYTAATYTTGWVDMSLYESAMAIIHAGDLGSSATLDGKLQQATDSGGTGAKDVTGKAITQLTQAGTDSNKKAVINLMSEELDVANGFRWIRISMTVGTATSDAGADLLLFDPRYEPAHGAFVDEVVT